MSFVYQVSNSQGNETLYFIDLNCTLYMATKALSALPVDWQIWSHKLKEFLLKEGKFVLQKFGDMAGCFTGSCLCQFVSPLTTTTSATPTGLHTQFTVCMLWEKVIPQASLHPQTEAELRKTRWSL